MPSPIKNREIAPQLNWIDLNKLSGTIGSLTFNSVITNKMKNIEEAANKERIKEEFQPFSLPFISAKVKENIAIEIVIIPKKSMLFVAVGS